ncbi:MBL fold metallo-hydrolase [Chloroflexota bacterium]
MRVVELSKSCFTATELRGCKPGFIITSEGIVLIDCPVDLESCEWWAKEIAKHGKPIYLITTEFHPDHNLHNKFFKVPVISSEITRELMLQRNTEPQLMWRRDNLYTHPLPIPTIEEYRKGLASITFTDRMELHLGSHTVHMILLPGHSPGQTTIYVPEEKVAYCSDNVSASGSIEISRGMPYQWLESLDVLKTLDIDAIACGHGPAITENIQECLDQMAKNLHFMIDEVKKAKTDELSIDEAIDHLSKVFPDHPTPAYEDYNPMMGKQPGHVFGFRGAAVRHLWEVVDLYQGYKR